MSNSKLRKFAFKASMAAIASVVLAIVLVVSGGSKVLFVLMWPILGLGNNIAGWIDSKYPPQGGAWAEPLGTIFEVDAVLGFLLLWVLLMLISAIVEKLLNRRKRIA